MNIGAKIRLLLKQYGWTQPNLASKTGLSQPFISAICRGEKQPSLEKVLVLCRAFSITPNDLLCEDNKNEFEGLTENEDVLIKKYRLLSPRDKETVMGVIDLLGRNGRGALFTSQNGRADAENSNLAQC